MLATPKKPATASLPADVWLTLVDHIAANDTHPGRFHDLAQLSWTCRDAYKTARRPLWQHLRLVLRIKKEANRSHDINDDTLPLHFIQQVQQHVQLHQEVLDSSVFPRYRTGQLAEGSERLKRIREVSKEFVHLQPFVVLDGQLYLASLLGNERNVSDPDFSGIASLWGDDLLVSAARVIGGLVLVPYPLNLVQELTIDGLVSAISLGSHLPALGSTLPFILSMDPKQIRSFHFFALSICSASSIHNAISERYTHISRHDYLLLGNEQSSPAFGPATSHVRICHGKDFDSDFDMFAALEQVPNLVAFELMGSAELPQGHNFFQSSTLARLVLDFYLIKWSDDDDDDELFGFDVDLPKLKEFTLTFTLADLLLGQIQAQESLSASPPSSPSRIPFPSLTHLTLLDIEDRRHIQTPEISAIVPRIPYHVMPNLTHFAIPFHDRGFDNYQAIIDSCLRGLISHTKLESFVAPGLVGTASEQDEPGVAVPAAPMVAKYLTHVEVSSEMEEDWWSVWVAMPNARS